MLEIVWHYLVRQQSVQKFEVHYGPGGTWAKLFEQAEGYLGTRLLKDQDRSMRYLTIDRWKDVESFERFKQQFGAQYAELDGEMNKLTKEEDLVGMFEVV